MRSGSSTEAAGANTPSFISGWPNCASGAANIRLPASANSSPPPRHWPRHRHQDRPRPVEHRAEQAVQRAQHLLAGRGQVLLDARAEGEVRPLVVDQRGEQAGVVAMRGERAGQRGDHRRVDEVGLGPREAQPQQRAVALQPDLERAVSHALCRGWMASCRPPTQLSPAASFCRSSTKSDLAVVLRSRVERGEAGARLGHHVERQPGPRVLLVAVPGLELGLSQLLERLGGAVGEGEQDLGAQLLDLGIEHARDPPCPSSSGPCPPRAPRRSSDLPKAMRPKSS